MATAPLNVVASDAVTPGSGIACRVASVTSNQPRSDRNAGDWVIGPGLALSLRRARTANLGDRVYTIAVVRQDGVGHVSAPGPVAVTVPVAGRK